jgi:hypothetical protein
MLACALACESMYGFQPEAREDKPESYLQPTIPRIPKQLQTRKTVNMP